MHGSADDAHALLRNLLPIQNARRIRDEEERDREEEMGTEDGVKRADEALVLGRKPAASVFVRTHRSSPVRRQNDPASFMSAIDVTDSK